MTNSIITVATMKGGSGKSTLASCLAVHWQLAGPPHRPSSMPIRRRSIARLAAREKALGGVPVVEDATDETPGRRRNAWPKRLRHRHHRHAGLPLSRHAGLPRHHRFRAGPGQALAVRRRPDAGYAQYPDQRRQRTAADFPLRADADHARLRHRQAHPLRACRGRLPGAQERDDEPRRSMPEAALWGATPSLTDEKGPAARDIAAIANEVRRHLRQRNADEAGSSRMNKKKLPKAVAADRRRDARARRSRQHRRRITSSR